MDGTGGSASYAGYEYQILVTVWSALELMIVKPATDQLDLEAPSHEDIEADLRVARDEASLSVGAQSRNFRLVMQVKARSTGPWAAPAFRTLLLGSRRKPARKGPAPRARPFTMLQNDASMRYVLVTDAAVQGVLRSFHVDHILEESGAERLPFRLPAVAATPVSSYAGRLAVCDTKIDALLNYRIAEVLMRNGHVPLPNHAQCIRDLREQVRCRIITGGAWSADDVWRTLRDHGGSRGASPYIDAYVEPRSYPEIVTKLETCHAVIVSGPSGTGKTMTGMVLEERLKTEIPYSVVTEQNGFSVIERALLSVEPVLCHLRDPWGRTKVADDGSWTNELVNGLPRASAQHKFIITTRSEILAKAARERLSALEPFIVRLDIADYDYERRAKIFDKRLDGLSDVTRRFAEQYRVEVLEKLQRPFELDRFIVNVQRANNASERFEEILNASRVEAVADVVAQEVGEWFPDGPACAAIIWALLQADSEVPWTQLRSLEKALRRGGRVLDVEQFADFLVAGYNLRANVDTIAMYHPEVERGLEKGIYRARGEAERALEILCDALLVGAPREDSALAVAILDAIAQHKELDVELTQSAVEALDRALVDAASADGPVFTLQAFGRLARLGSARYPPAEFTRILWMTSSVPWTLGAWSPPTEDQRELMACVAREHSTLVRNYIRDVVSHSNVVYDAEFVKIMLPLIPNLDQDFLSALERIALAGWGSNIRALVLGACSGEPALRRVKQIGEELHKLADARWNSEFERDRIAAENHQLDEYYLEYFNMMEEQLWEATGEVLETLVEVVRTSIGYTWLIGPEKTPELIRAWVRTLEFTGAARADELLALAKETALNSDFLYWRVVATHWSTGLGSLLSDTFYRDDLTIHVRRALTTTVLTNFSLADQATFLADSIKLSSNGRQLQILMDVESSLNLPDVGIKGRYNILGRLGASASQPVARLANLTLASRSNDSDRRRQFLQDDHEASALLACAADDIVAELIIEAGRAGLDIVPAARRVIASGNASAAGAAVRALVEFGGPIATELITVGLSHPKFTVRAQALVTVLHIPDYNDTHRILKCARDWSPLVRLQFAKEMGRLRWASAIPELIRLLSDNRDFSSHAPGGQSPPQYDVALAAAQSIAAYDSLSPDTRMRLREVRAYESEDPRVQRAVAELIRRFDD